MAKNQKIRWRQKDKDKLAELMEQVSNKAEEAGLEKGNYPTATKRGIKTRAQYNEVIKRLEDFLKPGAEDVIKVGGKNVSKWKIADIQTKVDKINKARLKKRKKVKPSTERGTMGLINEESLKPKKFINLSTASTTSWEKFVAAVEKQSDENYYAGIRQIKYNNFMRAVVTQYGDRGLELQELIKQFTPDELEQMYYRDNVLSAGFAYEIADNDLHYRILKERLTAYVNEKNA